MIKSVLELIGNTPMVKLNKIGENIFVKLEGKNPGGSVKDRAVLGIIESLEKNGDIKPGDTIIEATSGNTGISLSMIGNLKGYKVKIIMPETMSKERRDLISAYGAELILTEGPKGMQGTLDMAKKILDENPSYKMLRQFENNENPNYHYKTTGPEIYNDLKDVDIFVAGVGTGGTVTGIGRFLKEQNPNIKIVAVEPEKSPLLTKNQAGPHKIQGIGANFVPKVYDEKVVDEIVLVKDEDAFEMVRKLGKEEGLLLGISSGANVHAAIELSKKYPNKKIVTISPDDINKYMSLEIF